MSDTWTAITGYAAADYADTMVFKVDQGTKKLEKISPKAKPSLQAALRSWRRE